MVNFVMKTQIVFHQYVGENNGITDVDAKLVIFLRVGQSCDEESDCHSLVCTNGTCHDEDECISFNIATENLQGTGCGDIISADDVEL